MTECSIPILLAVRKGLNLQSLFLKLNLPKDFPRDFLEFKNDTNEIYKFFDVYQVNFAYLFKEFDLYTNSIPYRGLNHKTDDDLLIRVNKLSEMVNIIENQANENILVLFHGELTQRPLPLTLYSKEEIKSIFGSEDTVLIQSIIKNGIIEKKNLTKEELEELAKNLKVPLIEVIEELFSKQELDECFYYEKQFQFYYKIFGINYIKALLQYRLDSSYEIEYFNQGETGIKCLEIIKKKFSKSSKDLIFDNKKIAQDFCTSIEIIKKFYGSEELILFLNNNSYFDVLYELPELQSINAIVFKFIADSVLEILKSNITKYRICARIIHHKLMRILKLYIKSEYRFKLITQSLILNLLEPYNEKNKQVLVMPTIKCIPYKVLSEIAMNTKEEKIKNLINKFLIEN